MTMKQTIVAGLSAAALVLASGLAFAAGQYGPGVSDTEIKIGNTMPYSGPASSYSVVGKAEAAYFAMINEQGGINGRKINFISRDDGYSPPKTVEMARQLVEQDQVLLLFNPLGTPPNLAIRGYLNDNKVPQLFVGSGDPAMNDPKHYPWTIGFAPSYRFEGRVYGRYMLKNLPDAKIAVLYQNDDLGKGYLNGLREGLGQKADKMIVATQSYETTDALVDSQVLLLHGSGADTMLTAGIPKFAAQAIRKIYVLGWKPTHFLSNISASVGMVMQPLGPEKTVGMITAGYLKEPTDPQWHDTPEYREWLAWMKKYNPSGNVADGANVYAYSVAQTFVAVLKACGDNLTRENVMKQAASIQSLQLPMLFPGIIVSTSAEDFGPVKQMGFSKFDGTTWVPFGEVVSAAGN